MMKFVEITRVYGDEVFRQVINTYYVKAFRSEKLNGDVWGTGISFGNDYIYVTEKYEDIKKLLGYKAK